MTKKDIIDHLIANGNKPEICVLYADAYLEYKAAQKNIEDCGPLVACPRTGVPLQNPYLSVRDKAFARLESLHTKRRIKTGSLWEGTE